MSYLCYLEKVFRGKDLILLAGGVFLIYKNTSEIYHKMEGEEGDVTNNIKVMSFAKVLVQILLIDMVFSIDSIITAVGMARELWVMFVAVILSVGVMLFASKQSANLLIIIPHF